MTWKQALSQIKKEIKEDPIVPPKPSPRPKPELVQEPKSIEDEDALFLSAMGGTAKPAKRMPTKAADSKRGVEPVMQAVPTESMAAIEGIAPLKPRSLAEIVASAEPRIPGSGKEPTVEAEEPAPDPLLPALEQVIPPPIVPDPPPHAGPQLIQLAAGMAIDVDGTLDLNGHTVRDAEERLRERIQDAAFLGWRTLHVVLGPSEDLREMFVACLFSSSQYVARYAQAPIPMGGSQAWVIYLSH